MGIARITRDETVKWNQKTALRFQTGGRHQTPLVSPLGEGSGTPRCDENGSTDTGEGQIGNDVVGG